MGRDFVVLLNWAETGKPPLLGPQTSVLSYNQTAWYFYLLFPFFYATHYWAFSSTLTLSVVALSIFAYLAYCVRKDSQLYFTLCFCMILFSVQPQVVLQNRFIWNPSFLPYFLLLTLLALRKLQQKFSWKWLFLFWFGLAFAVGFSYSAVPLAALLTVYLIFTHYKKWWQIILGAGISAGVILLPMIAFELRYSFALTKLFINGQTTPQTAITLQHKTRLLHELVLPGFTTILLSLLVLLAVVSGYILYNNWSEEKQQIKQLLKFFTLFIVLLGSIYLLPINLEKHYIFPLLTLGFFTLSLLPRKIALVWAVFLTLCWIQPKGSFQTPTFQTAIRSVQVLEQCYQQFCAAYSSRAYVSMESGILSGYHNAPEHQFFLRKAGCKILDIETSQDQADRMLVIEDSSTFTAGKTGYRELSLFGPYTVGKKQKCSDAVAIQEIVRADSEDTSIKNIFYPQ